MKAMCDNRIPYLESRENQIVCRTKTFTQVGIVMKLLRTPHVGTQIQAHIWPLAHHRRDDPMRNGEMDVSVWSVA